MVGCLELIIIDIQGGKNTNERPGYLGSKNTFFQKLPFSLGILLTKIV